MDAEREAAASRHPSAYAAEVDRRPRWQQLAILPDFPDDEPMKLRRVVSARKVRAIREQLQAG